MSAIIELKYNMVEMITQLEDESSVADFYQIILEFLRERTNPNDLWDELTIAQRADIERAHKDSFNPENWVPHEVVLKKYQQWLKK